MRWLAVTLGLAGLLAASCAHRGPVVPARQKVEFTPLPDAEVAQVVNPHDFKGTPLCQRCHTPGETGPAVDSIVLCSQCHDASRMKHPFGVPQPSGAGNLPLFDGREIVCHTCHDPHDVKKFPHGLRAEFTAICLNCHKRH